MINAPRGLARAWIAGPWLLAMLAFLVVVAYLPILSTWLPRTLGMM